MEALESVCRMLDPSDEETIWYRGATRRSYGLAPSLMRDTEGLSDDEHDQVEQDLFFEFQAHASDLRARNLTDWEYMFFGRHYNIRWATATAQAMTTAKADPIRQSGWNGRRRDRRYLGTNLGVFPVRSMRNFFNLANSSSNAIASPENVSISGNSISVTVFPPDLLNTACPSD